ncbi:MAG: mannose-1-phosphate guanylyltransferase/mannose-6-phosphate isomerase [Desulfosarcinaceae bacterium]|jgi:mannose-1-phosphate guanylyltransferase/mannose-6-phosphate isomerase
MDELALKTYPVLLAGGSGTRLWPVSRELYPKQLVKFTGRDSLVQTTIKRLSPVLSPENIRIVCGDEHYHEIARHMDATGISSDGKVIREPCGRNTAPAILLAVLDVLKRAEDAIVCVFPADHVIREVEAFHQSLRAALRLAEAGYIVTFGIQPSYPETGYGYIEGEGDLPEGALALKRFVEKPDRETAQKYLSAGSFFWNAGMFAFKASVLVAEFQAFQADIYYELSALMASGAPLNRENYSSLPSISIDYAIMEKTSKGAVLPVDFGWSDIGSWKSLYDFLPKDENQNVVDGDVISKETHHCFILGSERLIATNHLENLVVVETPDSVFVSDIENSRDVKAIVNDLKAHGRHEYHHHRTVHYAWGSLTVLEHQRHYHVDRLTLYPNMTFKDEAGGWASRQLTAVEGSVAIFALGDEKILQAGEDARFCDGTSVYLKNPNNQPVKVLRICCGLTDEPSAEKR